MPAIRTALLLLALASVAHGQTYFGPVPYLSTADIPAGFHTGPFVVEDFEDAALAHGVTPSGGAPYGPASNADSVDADDGVIDGSGTNGRSWFGAGPMTFTFPRPVTSAGVVWTDGPVGTDVTFEAFGPGMVSFGVIGPFQHSDGANNGSTAEDRFYGIQNAGGIAAIRLSSIGGNLTIELDHLQFDTIGIAYCSPSVPNSTGASGVITAFGSATVSDDDFLLVASQLRGGQFGYFLASRTQGMLTPPASQGPICLSGNIGRFNATPQIIQGPTGQLLVDLSAIPVNPPTAVLPGDTWNFQCWYRDSNPAPTSNFTDAVEVAFL